MLSVELSHLQNRYLGIEDDRDRVRLDRLSREALPPALEAALELAGVRPWEDVCIPALHIRTKLSGDRGMEALPNMWAPVVADAVATALAGGDVVRYPNRATTLVDLVQGALSRRMGRSWAWQELGLWPTGPVDRPAVAAAQALLQDPTTILPVLQTLATQDAGVTERFLMELPEEEARTLVRSAALASGLPRQGLAVLAEFGESSPELSSDRSSDAGATSSATPDRSPAEPGPDLADTLSDAPLLAALARSGGLARPVRRVARARPSLRPELAALCLLDWDPSALRHRGVARRQLQTVVGWMTEPGTDAPDRLRDAHRTSRVEGSSGREDRRRGGDLEAVGGREVDADVSPPRDPSSSAASPDQEPVTPAADRSQARTRYGGLFFLLNALADHGLAVALLSQEELAGRSGRWILHRLSGLLVEAREDDAARLGFSGLAPDHEPPEAGAEITGPEEAALVSGAEAVRRVVGRRLGRERPLDDAELHGLVSRPARIVADPGWIEVHLPLDTVSLDLRKAGLDRDPGYLSWLGAVVRFVYE